jgi:hypothetical protein
VFPKTDLSSYFTMYRLDWMVDEKGKLYLLEVRERVLSAASWWWWWWWWRRG